MIRLVKIEWLKIRKYKVFWILLTLYLVGLTIVCSSGMFLMEYLKNQGAKFDNIDPTILPLYDFPDVWHNITYMATFFKILLAIVVIVSVTNEISYRTLRQNIIDGLSKSDFLYSKLSLIVLLSLVGTIFMFLEGLVTGLIYSHVTEPRFIFQDMIFLAGYFLELLTFLSLSFLVGLLLKKAGFAIVLIFMYTLIFEPFLTLNMEYNPHIPDTLDWIIPYMPIKSINNLIRVPFPKYVFKEIHDYIALKDTLIVTGWLIMYNALVVLVLRKRDL